jgi:response regulator RpfG family c-di-GMP phosphodiesterase
LFSKIYKNNIFIKIFDEMPSDVAINVLYIDDEVHNLNSFKAGFRRLFNVFTAESAIEGRKVLEAEDIHVIITDQRMPVMTGIEFLESIIPHYPDPIRILLTGYADINAVIDAINKGRVYKYIQKPWMDEDLRINIEKAYEIYALRKENRELTEQLLLANKQLEFLLRQNLLS